MDLRDNMLDLSAVLEEEKGWFMTDDRIDHFNINDLVEQISVKLRTGSDPHAGTDGQVFLFVGGREFRINRAGINDREPGQMDLLILGRGANVEDPDRNHPADPLAVRMHDVDRYPVWLRFAPRPKVVEGVKVQGGVLRQPVVIDPVDNLDPVDAASNDNWMLDSVHVLVRGRTDQRDFGILDDDGRLIEDLGLWLGKDFGLFVYLRRFSGEPF
jgi:hypothetical protein